MKHEDLTQQIIKAFYIVYNTLGYGFLEKVYERALAIELRKMGLRVKCQYSIKVYYDRQEVGDFAADMLVEDCVIVELKATRALVKAASLRMKPSCSTTSTPQNTRVACYSILASNPKSNARFLITSGRNIAHG